MVRYWLAAFATQVLLLGSPASAADWQSGETAQNAWAMISQGGKTLRLGCNRGNRDLVFTLTGGPFPGMKNVDDGTESMMMWIEMSDGRTARHPIDGHYFAPDRAFVGRFVVTNTVLEQFRSGRTLSLSAPTGAGIATFGMKGTGKARGHIKQACRL